MPVRVTQHAVTVSISALAPTLSVVLNSHRHQTSAALLIRFVVVWICVVHMTWRVATTMAAFLVANG
jgi:hypothetical protein